MEKLFGVKSLDKAIEVQSEYAKSIFEDYTAQVQSSASSTPICQRSFKPFDADGEVVTEKITRELSHSVVRSPAARSGFVLFTCHGRLPRH